MALVERFVNTASSAGGDGTTNGTSGATRAYASLNEWEAAEQTDLVSDGDTHLVHCEGSAADTTFLTMNGWTTGSSNDITVQVDSDVRHDGKWDTGAYRLINTNAVAFNNQEDYVSVIGLQIQVVTVVSNNRHVVHLNSGVSNAASFSYCILRGSDNDTRPQRCINSSDSDVILTFYNCLLYDAGNDANSVGINVTGTTTSYNNTIANCRIGIRGSGTWTEKNNLVSIDLSDGTECWFNDASHTRTFCAANDATANEQGGTGNRDSKTFTFVNEGADDYHLDADDVGALDFGTSDPGSGLFSDDIDGVTRTGSWDIGCDEFVAAPAAAPSTFSVPSAALEAGQRPVVYRPGFTDDLVFELIDAQLVMLPITTPTIPGEELKIEHNLGRIPHGYTLMTRPFQTFQHGHESSDTDWDTQFMYLRFSIVDTDLTIAVF